jgi:hypothetical protein
MIYLLGLHLLYPYLEHAQSEIRGYIAQMVRFYPEKRDEVLPLLEKALDHETSPYQQAVIKEVLQELRTIEAKAP